MIKLSNIVNNVIKIPPCILGAFFSVSRISDDNNSFYTWTAYKKTKFDKLDEYSESQLPFLARLNSISEPFKWRVKENIKTFRAECYIENDLDWTLEMFFNLIMSLSLNNDFAIKKNLNLEKKDFLRSFFELRGSIDTTSKYISIDLIDDLIQKSELETYFNDYYNIPTEYINFNYRESQPDYLSGKKRNPQIRIKLDWYAQNIGFLNTYKANISRRAYKEFGEYIEKDNSYLFLNTNDSKKSNFINDNKNANDVYNEIDKHFLINNKLIGENKTDITLTHFLDQKFTYDSLVLVCNIIRLLFKNENSISNKEILDFFDVFLKYGYQEDIFLKENTSKGNVKNSIGDSKTLLKQGLKILISSKIIEKVENQYNIINFPLINNIAISDMSFSIYFMQSYFKILLTELGVYNDFYESICKCISNNIGKRKFETASDLGDIKSKKQLHDLFAESLAKKFGNKTKSPIHITRILNKPIQYITFCIQEYYKISDANNWYSIEDLSYVDNFVRRVNEFISFLENIYSEIKLTHNKNGYEHMKDLISNHCNQLSGHDMMQKNDKKIEKEISDVIKRYSNDKIFIDNLVTDYISMCKSRIGQNNFRDELIKMHSSKCILSNVNIEEILIASHIIPWAISESKDRLNPHNGLLLSSSIDRLFDKHLISFNDKGELFYSDKLIRKYPDHMKQLEKIGIQRDYLYNKKSIFSEIDVNFHENIKIFLSEHFKQTKKNN